MRSVQQPRRKVSQTQQIPRNLADRVERHVLQTNSSSSDHADDEMDVDETPFFNPREAERALHPLRHMADRVGREVERFAEALDGFKPALGSSAAEKRKIALRLTDSYRTIAHDTVQKLAGQHELELQHEFVKVWQERGKNNDAVATEMGSRDSKQASGRTTVNDLHAWQAEVQTWDLVRGLLSSQDPAYDPGLARSSSDIDRAVSDRFLADGSPWQSFIKGSNLARERLMIIKWLEATAEQTSQDMELIEAELVKESGKGPGLWTQEWLETREKIKGEKRLRLWDVPLDSELPAIRRSKGDGLLITQLDPDAPTRQGRTLEEADDSYDQCSWTLVWEMLRRGRSLEEVRQWLCEHNQFSRAVSIGARALKAVDKDISESVASRFLWRHSCRSTARQAYTSDYERGVFGLLGGDLQSMERICCTWDDRVFAHYNSLLSEQYTSWLKAEHGDALPLINVAGFSSNYSHDVSFDTNSAALQVLHAIGMKNISSRNAHKSFKLVQASLIGHYLEEFAHEQGVALSRKAMAEENQSISQLIPSDLAKKSTKTIVNDDITADIPALRVLVHILLIWDELGYKFDSDDSEAVRENILAAYIDFLRLAGKMHLIPVYAARLSRERGEITLARVLPSIVHHAERQEYMALLAQYDFDIVGILLFQYEFATSCSTLQSENEKVIERFEVLETVSDAMWPGVRIAIHDKQKLHVDEEILIRSMEWFLLVEGQWAITFATLAELAIEFLLKGHVNAAVKLFRRLPFGTVSEAKTPTLINRTVNIMEVNDDTLKASAPTTTASTRTFRSGSTNDEVIQCEEVSVKIEQLKKEAMTYFQVGRLVRAIESVWQWREVEQQHITDNYGAGSSANKQDARRAMDYLCSACGLLTEEFLASPQDDTEAERFRALKIAYLPSLCLAQISALQSAAHLVSREYMLKCMDYSIAVAESPGMMACLSDSKRAPEVLDAFAAASKALLRLNEQSRSKAHKVKRGARSGWTSAIWDVEA